MLSINQKLIEFLQSNNIDYILHEHPAVYTVEEAQKHCYTIPGMHCKNLFLRDSKTKIFYLVTAPALKQIQLKVIRKKVKAKKITFARPEELKEILDLEPGAVSPFGLINDINNTVPYFIDQEVWNAEKVCFHPNMNDQTLELTRENFISAVKAFGNNFEVYTYSIE